MANEFYITAGLPAIDSEDIDDVGVNVFYITAGLVANDYTPAAGVTAVPVYYSNVILKKKKLSWLYTLFPFLTYIESTIEYVKRIM